MLHLPNGAIRLAPFYDLVCTRAIARISHDLALDVGGERNPSLIAKPHWEALARQCDIRPRFLIKLVEEMAIQLLQAVVSSRAAFEERFGAYPALQRIEQIVIEQCKSVIKQ